MSKRYGAAQGYYRETVLAYDGNDCLFWPFARDSRGYALLRDPNHGHRLRNVHRMVCEEENGPPPSPLHQAAHMCGAGMNGCVTRRHLTWATSSQNHHHKLRHGTHNRGERHPNSPLTDAQAAEILQAKDSQRAEALAEQHKISVTVVRDIWARRRWKHLREDVSCSI